MIEIGSPELRAKLRDTASREDKRILLRAAAIVRERWCQGSLGEPGGSRCAVGALLEALAEVAGVKESSISTFFPPVVSDDTWARMYSEFGNLVEWNDRKSQTAEEVARHLEEIAQEN